MPESAIAAAILLPGSREIRTARVPGFAKSEHDTVHKPVYIIDDAVILLHVVFFANSDVFCS